MGTTETNPSDTLDSSLTARNERQMDLFEYWSILAGQPRPVDDQFFQEASRRMLKAERLFPVITDKYNKAEDSRNRMLRMVELVMFVLESCNTAPNRQYFNEAWKKFATMNEIINSGGSADVLKLEPMDHETIKNLSEELDHIEVRAYLYERIVERVTQAVRLQGGYDYSDNQRIRQLTYRFDDQSRPEDEVPIPDRSKIVVVPCLRQLKLLKVLEDKKVLAPITRKRAEEVLRILIAQQKGFELPEPPPMISSVE